MLARFIRDERGVTLVEYGLLVGLISVVAIGAITSVGTSVKNLFQSVANRLANVSNL